MECPSPGLLVDEMSPGRTASGGRLRSRRRDSKMSVRIRLRRIGKKNQGCHRVVVADIRSPRDGRFIEQVSFYDPPHKTATVDLMRVDY